MIVLIDGVNETVKHETKKHKGGLLGALFAPFAASIVQSMISSVVKGISRRGVRRAGRAYLDKKTFNSAPSFEQYQDY